MTIDLQAAQAIPGWQVFLMGFGMVFIGLICIIILCSILGAICKKFIGDSPAEQPVRSAAPSQTSAIKNKGEFAAAIAAAIAEEMGTDVKGIRILSINKL
ncbi:MAG: OadG family protein [Clostridia bacterium]|nr:OadG family protein [Clostridia bacterium]